MPETTTTQHHETVPENYPVIFSTLVELIRSNNIASAVQCWDKIMEDRFMDGVAWDQDSQEPSSYYDRD